MQNPYKDGVKKVTIVGNTNTGKLRNPSITEYHHSKKLAGGSCTAKHVSNSSIDMKSLVYYNQGAAGYGSSTKYPIPKKLSISISSGSAIKETLPGGGATQSLFIQA
jgi:hypothetical protein